ncbi:MAG: DDE-type integrase/transposase/recombinase [Roseomonas sp.]|nr:DDE-type integrase/transposase/recombinase [Roseomonas sp.]
MLSDNGREFCSRPDQHPYELFPQLEDIPHRMTRVKRPQSNSIIERFHCTLLDEHFRVEGRRTWFETIEEMQAVLARIIHQEFADVVYPFEISYDFAVESQNPRIRRPHPP